jgi:hypothetical protein
MRRGVSLLLLAASLAAGPAAAQQQEEVKDTAKEAAEAFAEAKRLFEKNDYAGAVKHFTRAYELKPHFMVQCSIARCHEILNDMIRAAEHYRRCLAEGGKAAPNAEQVQESLRHAEARITWLEVESPGKGGTLYIDGREVGKAPTRLPLNPGTHALEVRREGAKPATATLEVSGGRQAVTLAPVDPVIEKPAPRPAPPTEKRLPSRLWFWIAAGATVALATMAIIFGAETLRWQSAYNENPTKDGLGSFKGTRTATNVLWGLTATAATGTAVLFFYPYFTGQQGAGAREERSAAFGVGVRGTF